MLPSFFPFFPLVSQLGNARCNGYAPGGYVKLLMPKSVWREASHECPSRSLPLSREGTAQTVSVDIIYTSILAGISSTAIESRKCRVPSAPRSQARYREISTGVRDHLGIPRAVVFALFALAFFTFTPEPRWNRDRSGVGRR